MEWRGRRYCGIRVSAIIVIVMVILWNEAIISNSQVPGSPGTPGTPGQKCYSSCFSNCIIKGPGTRAPLCREACAKKCKYNPPPAYKNRIPFSNDNV